MASTAQKRVLVRTDMHANHALNAASAQLARDEGIRHMWDLGDQQYVIASKKAEKSINQVVKLRTKLAKDDAFREGVNNGNYTRSQLEMLVDRLAQAESRSDAIARKEFEFTRDQAYGVNLNVIGGNWDKKTPLEDVFGDAYNNGVVTDVGGIKVGWASGGGTPPMFLNDLLADDPYLGIDRSDAWRQMLRGNPNIDVLATHVPDHSPHGDATDKGLREHLILRHLKHLPEVKTIFSGHLHKGTDVHFDELEDKASGTKVPLFKVEPGTAGFAHNKGAHASFVVAEFDDDNQVVAVDEYRVYDSPSRAIDLVHYQRHSVNHATREVETEYVGRMIKKGIHVDVPSDMYSVVDPDFAASFNLEYSGLDTQALDEQLRTNIALMEQDLHDTKEDIKRVVDYVRHKFLDEKVREEALDYDTQEKMQKEVKRLLAKQLIDAKGIDTSMLEGKGISQEDFKDFMLSAFYGVKEETIQNALHVVNNDTSLVSFDWGKDLYGHIMGQEEYSRKVLALMEDIEDDRLEELALLYAPTNTRKERSLRRDESINLWLKAQTEGLLTQADLLATGAYQKGDASGDEISDEELNKMFGVKPLYLTSRASNFDSETAKQLRDEIKGGAQVYKDNLGDYVLTAQGKVHLSEDILKGLAYDTKSLVDIIDTVSNPLVKRDNGAYELPGFNGYEVRQEHESEDLEQYAISLTDFRERQEQARRELEEQVRAQTELEQTLNDPQPIDYDSLVQDAANNNEYGGASLEEVA